MAFLEKLKQSLGGQSKYDAAYSKEVRKKAELAYRQEKAKAEIEAAKLRARKEVRARYGLPIKSLKDGRLIPGRKQTYYVQQGGVLVKKTRYASSPKQRRMPQNNLRQATQSLNPFAQQQNTDKDFFDAFMRS